MAKRLTDKQKKKIIADYVECQNYSAVARKYKISATTVKKTIVNDKESVRKCDLKKEENTKDMLDYLESKKESAMNFIDLALAEMMKEEKLERTGIQALATSVGIIVDKFTGTRDKIELIKAQTKAASAKIDEDVEEIESDGFIEALNGSAKEDWEDYGEE